MGKIIDVRVSIQEGIEKANPGDIVLVHGGVYRESLHIDTDNITVVAKGGGVILTGKCGCEISGYNGIEICADGVEIKGLMIKNFVGSGIVVCGNQNRIVDNIIYNCDERGIYIFKYGCYGLRKQDCEQELMAIQEENESLEKCGNQEELSTRGRGFVYGNLVYGNKIFRCGRDGIKVKKGNCTSVICNKIMFCGDDGIQITYYSYGCIILMNCVCCCNEDGIDLDGGCQHFVSDNKVCKCAKAGIEVHTDDNIIEYNCVEQNTDNGIDLKRSSDDNRVLLNKAYNNKEYDIKDCGDDNTIARNCCETSKDPSICNNKCRRGPQCIKIKKCVTCKLPCKHEPFVACECFECPDPCNFFEGLEESEEVEEVEEIEEIEENESVDEKRCDNCGQGRFEEWTSDFLSGKDLEN